MISLNFLIRKLRSLGNKVSELPGHSSYSELNALYALLYDLTHQLESPISTTSKATLQAFSNQWSEIPEGNYLLSDPWFKERITDILSTQELLLRKEWFKDKKVLDAGCGNGRWAYGLSKLGSNVTCVDANLSALNATKAALDQENLSAQFIQSPLEEVASKVAPEGFDLVFSWGVLHHCGNFIKSLDNLVSCLKPGGIIYLYLYGKASMTFDEDLALFKKRIAYNFLYDSKERHTFLLKESGWDENKVHNFHDVYAPLINRRFLFSEVQEMLEQRGFSSIIRTINHPEVFIRATKGSADYSAYNLTPHPGPFWFEKGVRPS